MALRSENTHPEQGLKKRLLYIDRSAGLVDKIEGLVEKTGGFVDKTGGLVDKTAALEYADTIVDWTDRLVLYFSPEPNAVHNIPEILEKFLVLAVDCYNPEKGGWIENIY